MLGDQWTLLIIRDAMMGVRTFSGFEKSLGLTRRMLSRRLNEMVQNDLLTRTPVKEGGSRHHYIPTQKTKDLAVLISSFIAWGEKYYPHPKGKRYDIREAATGSPVTPGLVAMDTNTMVPVAACQFLPGPAASAK